VQRPRAQPCPSDISAWRRAEEAAAHARRALQAAREQVRVARLRAADRRHHLEAARAAGQEAFALGLLHAAEAHEVAAGKAAGTCAELEARVRGLEALADRAAERVRLVASVTGAVPPTIRSGSGCSCGKAA
jgi:hypothetical protein